MEAQTDRTQADSPGEKRTGIFVSHSRKDKHFVGHLKEALERIGYDVWVDVEDILPTEDWLAGVYSGIEEADAFLFVISPDAVRSEDCQRELDHAVEHNKRLVPVVYRTVADDEVPESLRVPEWIFFRDGDDFDSSLRMLTVALDTDLEWVHAHTRLLTRAIEWDDHGRDNSFVLRGSDLQTAEEWQAKAAGKEPPLTSLQSEYIVASRRAERRRQRLILGAVTVGLIVAIVLGAVALWQRNVADNQRQEAIEQRDEAERQANIALSRQLAAQSELVRNQDGGSFISRSALLAVESMRRVPSVEGDQAVREALDLLPSPVYTLHSTTPDHKKKAIGGQTKDAIFSAAQTENVVSSGNRDRFAAAVGPNSVLVWEAKTGKEAAHISSEGEMAAVDLSPDGASVATISMDGTAQVWDVKTEAKVAEMVGHVDPAKTSISGPYVVFGSDGELLATTVGRTVSVWDARTARHLTQIHLKDPVEEAVFSPDGNYLATADDGGTAVVWDVETGEKIAEMVGHLDAVTDVVFSPDGERLATASADGTASIWEVRTGTELARMTPQRINEDLTSLGTIDDIAFSPDGESVATAGSDGTVRLWEARTGGQLAAMEVENYVTEVTFSPDGDYVAAAGSSTARVWETASGHEVARIDDGTMFWATGVDFTSDGKHLVTASRDTVQLWKVEAGDEIFRVTHGTQVNDVAFSANGKYLATASWDGTARVLRAATGEEVARMDLEKDRPGISFVTEPTISRNSEYLAMGSDSGIVKVWDIETGDEVARMEHEGAVHEVAFSLDGERLATASLDGTARMWDIETGDEIARMGHDDRGVWSVDFSPDGAYLATTSDDGGNSTLAMWDAKTGDEVASVGLDTHVNEAAFSPDNQVLITANGDGTVRGWDWRSRSGRRVFRWKPHKAAVTDVAFSLDGKFLATASRDSTASVWRGETGEEVARIGLDTDVSEVTFAFDSKHLATVSLRTVSVWEAQSGKEITRITHADGVEDVDFSPNSKYLATASVDGTARMWTWQREDLIEEACGRLTRNLSTYYEWPLYLGDRPYRHTCPGLPVPK